MNTRLCKTCLQTKNTDAFRERFQECKDCVVERTRKWRIDNKERHWTQWRSNYLKKYGLSLRDFSTLIELNGDVCITCGGREVAFVELHVDHDHADPTGHKVRGLLCDRCNQLLGKVKDDPAVLEALAQYLEQPPPTLCAPETPRIRKTRSLGFKKGPNRKNIEDEHGNRECRKCLKYLPASEYLWNKYSCKACIKAWGRAWREANPITFAESKLRVTLRSKFGITPGQSADLLERQGGVCAVCKKPDATGRELCHDHIHGTEGKPVVRGLLCTLCNFAEGMAKSSPLLLRKLATYIRLSLNRPQKWWLVPEHAQAYKYLRSTPTDGSPPTSPSPAV